MEISTEPSCRAATRFSGAIAAILVAASIACGDGGNDAPDAAPDSAIDECVTLTLDERSFQTNLFGQLTGLSYAVAPEIGGDTPERLLIELYDSTTEGLPPLIAGTFALGAPPNDQLATCQHCVWMPLDWNGVEAVTTVLFATEGELTLTAVADPLDIVFAGTLANVVLREATLDENGNAVLRPDGACARVDLLEFDTTPTPGAACLSAEDCGNELLEICDPVTNTCAAPQCGEFQGCPEERPVCLFQVEGLIEGACYAMCDPSTEAGCGEDQDCVQLGVDPGFGVCKTIGGGAVGAACELEDNGTSCVDGSVCSPETRLCTHQCEFFTAEPGCEEGAQCTVLGWCAPATPSADIDFGQSCGETAGLAEGCAADGEAFRGVCFAYEAPLLCERACFDDLGCNFAEEFCALRFTSGLGVCLPIPVCGDGVLGEINEACDDGNELSGDGCSGDCQVVEYGVICGDLDTVSNDATIPGDTASGWDGFQASCQFGIARGELVEFVPPGFGRLRTWVESKSTQLVSMREECADGGTELGCALGTDFIRPEVTHQVTDAAPVTILVTAATVLEEGPYTLHVEWTDESCGDGVVAGRELCDDGNSGGGDGCSADCRTIEYGVLCAAAPALVPGTPYTGDNTGGTTYFAATCSNDVYGSGPERLHVVTAAAAGTLRFRLDQGASDLTLAVYGACGAPAGIDELGCSSVYGVEEVEVDVTAGESLMVLVEGFGEFDVGPYTLSTDLLPP